MVSHLYHRPFQVGCDAILRSGPVLDKRIRPGGPILQHKLLH